VLFHSEKSTSEVVAIIKYMQDHYVPIEKIPLNDSETTKKVNSRHKIKVSENFKQTISRLK
jgi:hypothetical protein